jgi:hypothetical protein
MSCLARFRFAPALVLNTTISAWLDKRSRIRWNRPARRWAVICIPLLAACGGCDNPGITPPPPAVALYDVTGQWMGSLPPEGMEVRLNLIGRDGMIQGAGAISVGERIVTMQVVGSLLSSGEFVLNFYPYPPNRILYRGRVTSDSTMSGTLTESGFAGEEMTITRWKGPGDGSGSSSLEEPRS